MCFNTSSHFGLYLWQPIHDSTVSSPALFSSTSASIFKRDIFSLLKELPMIVIAKIPIHIADHKQMTSTNSCIKKPLPALFDLHFFRLAGPYTSRNAANHRMKNMNTAISASVTDLKLFPSLFLNPQIAITVPGFDYRLEAYTSCETSIQMTTMVKIYWPTVVNLP